MELNEEYITSGSNQALLLAELWKNERLFLVAQSVPMKPEDFPMPSCALIYGIMLDYRRKYGKMPSMPALQDIVADTIRADGSYTESSIKEVCEVLSIMTEDTTMDFDYVNDRLVKFIRESRISEAIARNPNDTERVAQAVKEVEKLSAAGFQETQISPFENFRALLPQTEDDLDVKIPTGIPFLDFVTNGGLNASLHEIGLGLAGTGVGKALVNSDSIPTPKGWKTVGEIKEGDLLFNHNGEPVKVLKVHPQPTKKNIWIVSFADGRKVRCCGEHLWEYWFEGHRGRSSAVASTKELLEHANKHGGFTGTHGHRFRVRLCKPVDYPEANLPVDPYVVGAAIGNGCLTQWQFAISSNTDEVPDAVAEILGAKAVRKCEKNYSRIFELPNGHRLQNREVFVGSCADYLLGKYSHEKAIPPEYLTASIQQRLRLLQGLLDTDGSISRDGKGRISYSTTSPQLAADVVQLCHSLGMSAKATAENRTYYASQQCFNIRIQCEKSQKPNLFTVSDKKQAAKRYASDSKRSERKDMLAIVGIEQTDELADMTCFTVDSDDGLFLCDDYIVTHNTNMMINFAISAAMAGYCTLFVTTELTQAQISRRLFAMAAHISMKEFKLPCSKWAKENLERLEYLSNSKLRDCIRIADRSKHACTVSDISGEVERWKRSIKELHGTDEKCKLVIIDWLDMLIPEPQMARTLQQPYQVLEQISKDLVHMVHNQDVALWCVSQTNRSGANAQKVQLNHASGAYAKNFFASIVLGLSKINEDDEDRSISQNMSEDDLKRLNIECNNDLHLSVIKNRDSVQRESDIYQGPTLRFWPSRSAWRTTEKILGSNDMKKIFGDGI